MYRDGEIQLEHPEALEEPSLEEPLPLYTTPWEEIFPSSQEGVEEFQALLPKFPKEDEDCWNITPADIAEHSDYRLFQFKSTGETYLLYGGNVCKVGFWVADAALYSLALGDLDEDGVYELYFSAAGNTGIPQSILYYYDPHSRELVRFPCNYQWHLPYLSQENGVLILNVRFYAQEQPGEDSPWVFQREETVGQIVYRDGEIQIDHSGYNDPEGNWSDSNT